MKKNTYLMSACFIILVAGCLYYFFKDEPLVPQGAVAPKVEEASTLSYAGNSITEEKDGKRVWELGAETIDIDVNTKNMLLKNIKGTFYQDNGGKIDITASQGTMDNKTKNIVMTGTVHAVASDGSTFTAAETRWLAQEQLFSGAGNIICTKDDTVMTGDTIESDKNMTNIKIAGHAKIVKGGASK